LFQQTAKDAGLEAMPAEFEQALAIFREQLATETQEFDGVAIKVHERRYLLGTDGLGRDLLSRIIYGSQVSISIGMIGTLTAVMIGLIIGALAGYIGGAFDYLVMRVVDVMYGLPYMLLVIIFMAVFGRNIINLFVCLALVSWLTVSRVVRGQMISLKNSEFVQAARVVGASPGRIIFRHLVPNTLGVVVIFATLQIPNFILLESFLSYLGLGVQAPMASWGSLVRDGVDAVSIYPWMLFFPALAMTIFLFSMNFLGDGLRDALDPQSKNAL
jgi:oligopeptide transport system permease protein